MPISGFFFFASASSAGALKMKDALKIQLALSIVDFHLPLVKSVFLITYS